MINFVVVLVETEFEETIGFTARAMKNFGIHQLRLVNPVASLSSVAHSRAGHAQDIIHSMTVHKSLNDAIKDADLSVATSALIARSTWTLLRRPVTPRELSEVITSTSGTIALVFGREGTGLNNNELGLCDLLLTIPASIAYPTMNLSHAAAIVFYELFQSSTKNTHEELLANQEAKSKILEFMTQLATCTGMKEYKVGLAVKTLRNILGRSAIRRREASVLAGTLRSILKTKQPSVMAHDHLNNHRIMVDESEGSL